mgnify:CR=1 FL=1
MTAITSQDHWPRNIIVTMALALVLLGTLIPSSRMRPARGWFAVAQDDTSQLNEPVIIIGDQDLMEWPGSGTVQDPYVISGLTVRDTAYCILVTNTTAHFVIRDCVLRGASGAAILLSGVVHATVLNNRIMDSDTGISVIKSDHVSIQSNRITGCKSGISVEVSTRGTIHGNSVFDNSVGVLLQNVTGYMITANDIFGNDWAGVSLYLSQDNTIYANHVGWNGPDVTQGIEKNAMDSGGSNHWDDARGSGNFWHDWNGTAPYLIEGTSNSTDRFPALLEDDTPPQVDGPSQIIAYLDKSGPAIVTVNWTVEERFPRIYSVTVNDMAAESHSLINDTIHFVTTRPTIGTLNVTVIISDWEGNEASHSVTVEVVPAPAQIDSLAIVGCSVLSIVMVAAIVLLIKRSK